MKLLEALHDGSNHTEVCSTITPSILVSSMPGV